MPRRSVLDAGADDFLTKPFSVEELLARVGRSCATRRPWARNTVEPVFTVGNWKVDLSGWRVFVDDKEVHLTATEYRLLSMLVRYAGKVVTHQQLLREVWGPGHATENQYVHVYMTRRRHKLETCPGPPAAPDARTRRGLPAQG